MQINLVSRYYRSSRVISESHQGGKLQQKEGPTTAEERNDSPDEPLGTPRAVLNRRSDCLDKATLEKKRRCEYLRTCSSRRGGNRQRRVRHPTPEERENHPDPLQPKGGPCKELTPGKTKRTNHSFL
ncbi:hypothetical protein Trydic_g15902 [Trypoxylus dichotomus]